jgi:hypothetical protein
MRDIIGALTVPVMVQYVRLREQFEQVALNPDAPDSVAWRWSVTGSYSASIAYRSMCYGQSQLPGAKRLWCTKAPAEFKFHIWLACRTSERRRRAMASPRTGPASCVHNVMSTPLITFTLGCVFSREVWFVVLHCVSCQQLVSEPASDWWLRSTRVSSLGSSTRTGPSPVGKACT